MFPIFLLLSTFSFWFEDRIGVHPPVWNLIAFGRYPLSIYSGIHSIFAELDYPFRIRFVLSQRRGCCGRTEFARYALLSRRSSRRCASQSPFWSGMKACGTILPPVRDRFSLRFYNRDRNIPFSNCVSLNRIVHDG